MTTPALQWRPTNAPVASSRTDDIWFIDPATGWAVNSNGQILMTTDGGNSWTEQFRANGTYLRCVGFASRLKGWVGTLTEPRRMFQTRDGGLTWEQVTNLPAVAPAAICGLSVVNESVIYASGTNYPNKAARMMKSVDGGETWSGWEMGEHATLLVDTYFTSPDRGWVVGGKASVANPTRNDVKPVVLFTEDGGRTWVNRVANLEAQLPLGEWGWKIFFLNQSVGYVSLENFRAGAILKTTDGGETWTRKVVNDQQGNANLEGIGFVDENHGWVGGWGSANFQGGFSSETLDGGDNWRDANEIGRFINRFRFFGNPVTVGYASGRTVFKYSAEPVAPHPLALASAARILATNEPQDWTGPVEIAYTVPGAGAKRLTIDIWDRFGQYVRKLRDEDSPLPGSHSVIWNLEDDAGYGVSPGAYIYRITVDDEAESRIIRLNF
ncbi:MAG: YCF48-related protein [Acidobacteriota bacterium]